VAPLENWASLLHKHGLKAEDVEVLAGVLHRTVLVLSRLAGDLAALDEVTDAELAVRFAVFDLREAVSSVTHGVAPEAARKNIALNVALPDTPVPVFGDLVRLTQVVGNLLDNALKFTERPGSVSVELRSDGRSAELAVSDTGAGIAPEFLPLAFDKFMRAPVYDQDVARVATFIDRHYAEPLKVHDLAAQVGLGVVPLGRIFRAATGLSVPEYIVRVRLARAQELLLASDCSLTDIALAVGFYDLPHLDKAFRKWFGISPSDFQKKAGLAKSYSRVPAAQPPTRQPRRA
jgi:AraC-like DNA-binding protein